jgi:hypothetical protein
MDPEVVAHYGDGAKRNSTGGRSSGSAQKELLTVVAGAPGRNSMSVADRTVCGVDGGRVGW